MCDTWLENPSSQDSRTHIHTHAHTHIHTHTYTHTRTRTHSREPTHTYTSTYIRAYIHAFPHIDFILHRLGWEFPSLSWNWSHVTLFLLICIMILCILWIIDLLNLFLFQKSRNNLILQELNFIRPQISFSCHTINVQNKDVYTNMHAHTEIPKYTLSRACAHTT